MNINFTPEELGQVIRIAGDLARLFAEHAATEHPLEKNAIEQSIIELVRPSAESNIGAFAQRIASEQIQAARDNFISLTGDFFVEPSRAKLAAEGTDLFIALTHERALLGESPSMVTAMKIWARLSEIVAANDLETVLEPESSTNETAAPNSED